MKRILLNITILGALTTMFSGCDTDIEAMDLQPAYKYSDEYYVNLRAYKETMHDRSLCFVWFSEYAQSTSLAYRFAGLPDSVDMCSLWGGIPDPELNPVAYREMWEMRRLKGTKLVAPTIIRIMENENYANFGLTYEDMVAQKTSIDPTGTYPDYIVLYGDYLLKQMWDSGIDGLDLDYEPESGDEQRYGIYNGTVTIGGVSVTRTAMTLFVKYLAQFIGPMSPNPDKLLVIDGHNPGAACNPYINYFVQQAYNQGSPGFSSNFPPEKQIFTENIGQNWNTGGQMLKQAAIQPATGYKGGFGAFYCQRDYNTVASGAINNPIPYATLRKAIQIQNPAVVK